MSINNSLKFHIPLFFGEFGFELSIHIPFVNYLFMNNALESCEVMDSMKEWYIFLPNEHVIICNDKPRLQQIGKLCNYHAYKSCYLLNSLEIPFTDKIHQSKYDTRFYKPPVLKGLYGHISLADMDSTLKPLLIIHNKYTSEWGGPPINFISIECLQRLLQMLHPRYTIVYIHPTCTMNGYTHDNQPFRPYHVPNDLWGYGYTIQTLMQRYNMSYNKLQLALHDRCSNFISVQGGSSRIASYFDGINIIFHKKGGELTVGSYDGYFKELSKVDIHVVQNDRDLIQMSRVHFLDTC